MKISVKVKPAAKEEKITKVGESEYEVWVKEPPVQGRANAAVIRALADYLGTAQSNIKIVSGFTSKNKIFLIQDN